MYSKRKAGIEIFDGTSQAKRETIAMLRKAVRNGRYEIEAGSVASKIIRNLVLQCVLIPKSGEYSGWTAS